MKKIYMTTLVLLVGGMAIVSPSASAEDVSECIQAEDGLEVCVYDTSSGDREEACREEGSGEYHGETGAELTAAGSQAGAGGEEDCSHQQTHDHDERTHGEIRICVRTGDFGCTLPGAGVVAEWSRDGGVIVQADTGGLAGYHKLDAVWGEQYGSCVIAVSYQSFNPLGIFHGREAVDCPAEPADPPNPGWGQTTAGSLG